MTKFISRFTNDESGATAIEYGLIAAVMAVAIIAAFGILGEGLSTQFTALVALLNPA